MKKQWIVLAVLAAVGGASQAQDIYGGIGFPGLMTLGYAQPISSNWGVRGEYAGGLKISKDGVQDGVPYTGTFKANRLGLFGDWFPFGGGFRLVGGVTANDMEFNLNAVGSGTATINGKTVPMNGQTFNVSVKYPSATPYIGIGYGHQSSAEKGLGFYADLGVMIGSFTTSVNTSLVGQAGITQADIDAQTQKARDSVSSLTIFPSVSMGIVYRY